ncbi:hypothetical protein HKD37_06G017189 [Glycine soja]
MLLCCISCFLLINLRFIRGCTRTININLCFFLIYQLNIFPFNFCFVNYSVFYKSKGETKDIELVEEERARIGADCCMHSEAEALEHMKKRDTGHQSVSLENKTGDSTVLKIGNSTKVVIKQDMKGRMHKYGFNNNKREKAEKVKVVDDEIGDKHQLDEVLRMPCTCGTLGVLYLMSSVPLIMGSPPASTPPPPPPPSHPSPLPPPPPSDASASPSTVKRTRKASHLRSLSTRPPGAKRPVVHVDSTTGKADGPHRKKLRTYLGIVARDKAEFDIPEASDSRTKRKLLQTVGERWRQFKSDLTRKWALTADQDGVEDTVCEKYGIRKEKWAQFCQTHRDPSWEDVRKKAQAIQKQNTTPHVLSRRGYNYVEQKLLAEKTKKKLEEAAQSGSVDGFIDPPSPVRRHVKWKMARTKKTGEMTTEAAKEIAEKIDSFEEQTTQGSFVPRGRQDVLAVAIGRPEHPGRVRAARAGVTIKQYFGSAPRTSRNASSLPPDELQQLIQQIRDQLEESITEKVTRQMQSQRIAVPPDPLVGPSGPRVSTKGSCVDPSGNDPEMGNSDRCGLYIEAGYLTLFHEQVVVSPAKPPPKPDPEVDDPLYLMTLTIPELFLRPYQVRWDATVFGDFNPDFPLYIKHEDLSEIAHGGQCLSISVLQLWILHLTETCMRVGNSDIYGFLEPQSIQRSGQSQFESESYIKSWMQSSQRDVYLGAYLNGPDNYLKGIINRLVFFSIHLHCLDDAPQPKSKASARWIVVKCNRQKGSTKCGYYVMHWMSTIILGTFRNNWEAYFNDPRPLEPERLKALRIQWAQFYLRVRDQA